MAKLLSPRQLGEAIGVSEASLKRWIDAGRLNAARTAGGHRRVELCEALRFIRQTGVPVLKPELLELPEISSADELPRHDPQRPCLLHQSLAQGEGVLARACIMKAFVGGKPLPELLDGPVAQAMRRLGDEWRHGADGIFLEHRATDICLSLIHHIRAFLPEPHADSPAAVGAAPPQDPYILPSLMAATVLRDLGWRDTNLGPDTPFDALLEAVAATHARLVWLSITAHTNEALLTRKLGELARKLLPLGAHVVVGGQACPLHFPSELRIHRCHNMAELASYARGLLTALSPIPTRATPLTTP